MRDAPVDLRLLAGAGAPARDFKAGEVIFREGDPAYELFIIQSGAAVTDTKLVSVSEKQFLFLVSSRHISRSTSCASCGAPPARSEPVSLLVARLGSHSPTPHANGRG